MVYSLNLVRAELERRHAAATPGQWYCAKTAGLYPELRSAQGGRSVPVASFTSAAASAADREFIEYCHEYVPVLLRALDNAEQTIRTLQARLLAAQPVLTEEEMAHAGLAES